MEEKTVDDVEAKGDRTFREKEEMKTLKKYLFYKHGKCLDSKKGCNGYKFVAASIPLNKSKDVHTEDGDPNQQCAEVSSRK